MKRQDLIVVSSVVAVVLGGFSIAPHVLAQEIHAMGTAQDAVDLASVAVDEARTAIEKGKQHVAQIPADSALTYEVKEKLVAAASNWDIAVQALDGANASALKVDTASSQEVAGGYELLSRVNAYGAISGANVVKIGLLFVEAVAVNKVESLDFIRIAMQDAVAASAQVQFNYERVKAFMMDRQSMMADASGIIAEIASLSVQSKLNLANAALTGDIDLIREAALRADAVDAALAEAQEAFSELETAQANESSVAE